MTAQELNEMGFKEVDENEYSNGDFTIFILPDNKLSIIGDDENNFLSIPELNCGTKEDLISFFKLVNYDLQS